MVCYRMCALASDQGWLRHWTTPQERNCIEMAERFKFFKRVQPRVNNILYYLLLVQQGTEGVAEYIAELQKPGKTCNFGVNT